jgi:hypothetical protein
MPIGCFKDLPQRLDRDGDVFLSWFEFALSQRMTFSGHTVPASISHREFIL